MPIEESHPIVVYDVENKKLVLIFRSVGTLTVYLFDGKVRAKALNNYINKKWKNHDNRFGKAICFRNAKVEHIKQLNDANVNYIVLDDNYQYTPKKNILRYK
jgi:hypothetical protein